MYHRASRSWNLAALLGLLLMTACTDTSTLPTDMGPQFGKGKKRDTEPQFVITTIILGTLQGSSTSFAKGIVVSDDGSIRVVGSSGRDALYWTDGDGDGDGDMVKLTSPGVTILTDAVDINDGGQIVGRSLATIGGGLRPLFWSSSGVPAIVLEMGLARSSYATAINNSGQVVGQSWDHSDDDEDGPHQHAMLWTVVDGGNVTTQDLHKDFGSEFVNSVANGINDSGQVVGSASDGIRERAFVWDEDANGVVTVTMLTVLSSGASAINKDGQITGIAVDQSGEWRALLWTVVDGSVEVEELPVPAGLNASLPSGLNDFGEVVGPASPTTGKEGSHAILWTFDPLTYERIAVDLGVGSAQAIGNSASGLTRVVGFTTITSGKGRNKNEGTRAIVWEVGPSP